MPAFTYTDANYDMPDPGLYLAQVAKAERRISKSGGAEMIVLGSAHDSSMRYSRQLLFGVQRQAAKQRCHNAILSTLSRGNLATPKITEGRFDMAPADCLHRACLRGSRSTRPMAKGTRKPRLNLPAFSRGKRLWLAFRRSPAFRCRQTFRRPKTLAASPAGEERKKARRSRRPRQRRPAFLTAHESHPDTFRFPGRADTRKRRRRSRRRS